MALVVNVEPVLDGALLDVLAASEEELDVDDALVLGVNPVLTAAFDADVDI